MECKAWEVHSHFKYEMLSFGAATCLAHCRLQQILSIDSMR